MKIWLRYSTKLNADCQKMREIVYRASKIYYTLKLNDKTRVISYIVRLFSSIDNHCCKRLEITL